MHGRVRSLGRERPYIPRGFLMERSSMIHQYKQSINALVQDMPKTKRVRTTSHLQNAQRLQSSCMRKWMVNRGKSSLLNFTDHDLKNLRKCFKSLCKDTEDSFGPADLQDSLIGLGIAESPEQVQDLFAQIDDDCSGKIEFTEFVDLLQSRERNQKSKPMVHFLKGRESKLMIRNRIKKFKGK